MKKMVSWLSLSLAAFAFLMSPALRRPVPPQVAQALSDADHAFLATLAVQWGLLLRSSQPSGRPSARSPSAPRRWNAARSVAAVAVARR